MISNNLHIRDALNLGNSKLQTISGVLYIDGFPILSSNIGASGTALNITTDLTPTGLGSYYISYPTGLNYAPTNVVCNLQSNNPTQIIPHVISGMNASGFYIHFSNLIPSGYTLFTLAFKPGN